MSYGVESTEADNARLARRLATISNAEALAREPAVCWLRCTEDLRAVCVVLARLTTRGGTVQDPHRLLRIDLHDYGLAVSDEQARRLLEAVVAWDENDGWGANRFAQLTAAVTAIGGEKP